MFTLLFHSSACKRLSRARRTPSRVSTSGFAPVLERADALDREMGCPFAWYFLTAHGYGVDPDVGHAIAAALREQRVRLPERDARVLLRWDEARNMC